MNSKLLLIPMFLFSLTILAQDDTKSYYYNDAIIVTDHPSLVKEYSYDETQVATLTQNHTFKFDAQARLIEHVQSNQGVSDLVQIFRDKFEYDAKSRLVHYWNVQDGNTMYSQEESWIFDTYDMLTDRNVWSVTNGTKYLGEPSYKRVITRDANNNVLKIEKSIWVSNDDAFVLDKVYTFKYDANNILDSIILFKRNITLGGKMMLESKQYEFDFKNYNTTNTDLLTYNSYQISDYDDYKLNIVNTYDSKGQMTLQVQKDLDGDVQHTTQWIYESDKTTTISDDYEKNIDYIDASGRVWKNEKYTSNGTDWDLEDPAYSRNLRTFEDGKITSDLFEGFYDSQTDTYTKETRYDYEYSSPQPPVTTAVANSQTTNTHLLYPNPSSGMVYVKDIQDVTHIAIASIDGVTHPIQIQEAIDLSDFQAGVYVVTIEYKNQQSSKQRLILK